MFENETARRNHWLALDLIGPRGNLQAVGARVEALEEAMRRSEG